MPRTMTSVAVAALTLALVGGLASPADAAPKKPTKVTKVKVTSKSKTTFKIAWAKAKRAKRYEVVVASNKKLTKGVKRFTTTKRKAKITRRVPGTASYVAVRALGATKKGKRSTKLRVRTKSSAIGVRVASFNVCGVDSWCTAVRPQLGPWTARKALAGTAARGTSADVLAVQEDRSADLRTELPGMAVAGNRGYVSLYYNSRRFAAKATGTFAIAGGKVGTSTTATKYAVWARLRDRATGTELVAVSTHLQPFKGKAYDVIRYAQTAKLIKKIGAVNVDKRPVVVAGDLNSSPDNGDHAKYPGGHDGPANAFANAGWKEAAVVAPARIRADFNSFHQARSEPLRDGNHLDRIFAVGGDVKRFEVLARLDAQQQYVLPWASDHNPIRSDIKIPGWR